MAVSEEGAVSTQRDGQSRKRGHAAVVAAQLRVGHAERERLVEELKEHTHAGRLELYEFDERVGRAYAARTAGELDALTADLPRLPGSAVEVTPRRRRRLRIVRGLLRGIWGTYLSVCLLMVFIWAATGAGYFWPIWVIGPWGLVMLPSLLATEPARKRRRARR
jgi:Domain of unknown function (DUF1707)